MNRRGFLRLLGAAGVAASVNPVHFLSPKSGWKTTNSGLAFLEARLELADAAMFRPLQEGDGRMVDVLMRGTLLLEDGTEFTVRPGDPPVLLREPYCLDMRKFGMVTPMRLSEASAIDLSLVPRRRFLHA